MIERDGGLVTFAELVASHGETLYGENWVGPMSEFIGVGPRNLRRLKAAVRNGVEYPPARGILAALEEALEELITKVERDVDAANRVERVEA